MAQEPFVAYEYLPIYFDLTFEKSVEIATHLTTRPEHTHALTVQYNSSALFYDLLSSSRTFSEPSTESQQADHEPAA
ncbi:hypothetical protein BD289DRAFT_482325 [Coniella lustricola]|uniref:Uncharacterized protein n=1 Tax=Coniella lustricola TaxID=2025994 RepID=A0A2T3A9A6_9PEZI|nr:hypothetical protein BD289DRAFT_482325 [Coniella lustricola]